MKKYLVTLSKDEREALAVLSSRGKQKSQKILKKRNQALATKRMGNSTRSIRKSGKNKNAKVNWQFTTEDARIKLYRLYPTLDI